MDVAALEERNLDEIERLNQRGGRSLSIVDLIEAGTISAEMVALCWVLIESGDSFLTGAVPGGAGKTTLMAALLGFLPPGERIVTTSRPDVVQQALAGGYDAPFCLLAHEIGRGSGYGYIWGRAAQGFFALGQQGARRVTCLHADTPQQVRDMLRECRVPAYDLDSLGMELFVHAEGLIPPRRRVSALHARTADGMERVYAWEPGDDRFVPGAPPEALAAVLAPPRDMTAEELLRRWELRRQAVAALCHGPVHYGDVRAQIVEAYRAAPGAGVQ